MWRMPHSHRSRITRLALRGSFMVTTRWPKGAPETADLGATTCTWHTSI